MKLLALCIFLSSCADLPAMSPVEQIRAAQECFRLGMKAVGMKQYTNGPIVAVRCVEIEQGEV